MAAAAVNMPDLPKTEQRWLMEIGCPYDITTRGSIPADWHDAIYLAEPVVLATANGVIHSVDRQIILMPIFLIDCKAIRRSKFGAQEVVNAQPYVLDRSPDVLSI